MKPSQKNNKTSEKTVSKSKLRGGKKRYAAQGGKPLTNLKDNSKCKGDKNYG